VPASARVAGGRTRDFRALTGGTALARTGGMSPGGHLVTTIAACSAAALATGSPALTAGVAAGGFLIDVDPVVDYVVFDGQRDLRPGTFLRYYLEGRARRLVLVLHSYEVFALLAVVAWWLALPGLAGYLAGGLMHLALDIAFNGQLTPRSIWAFYSFAHRLRHGFSAGTLLGEPQQGPASRRFWVDFFRGSAPHAVVDSRPRSCESWWSKTNRSSGTSSTIR
jgi:hypothetical protein